MLQAMTGADNRSGPRPALRRLVAGGVVALGLVGGPGAASAQVPFDVMSARDLRVWVGSEKP